jgi:hypothetical protein
MQAPAKSACSEREGVGLRFARGGYVACRLPKQAKTVFFPSIRAQIFITLLIRRVTTHAYLGSLFSGSMVL